MGRAAARTQACFGPYRDLQCFRHADAIARPLPEIASPAAALLYTAADFEAWINAAGKAARAGAPPPA